MKIYIAGNTTMAVEKVIEPYYTSRLLSFFYVEARLFEMDKVFDRIKNMNKANNRFKRY